LFIVAAPGLAMLGATVSVATVHEHVHQRAGQQEKVWQRTEDMRGVLGQQVEPTDGGGNEQPQAGR